MEISAAGEPTASVLSGRLKIPIRNLWLLMLYASDLFRHLEAKKVQWEDSPDDLPDLIAEILSHIVERRLKKQLGMGYRPVQETLSRIRGRIDWLKTECRQTMSRGKVVCRFGQLTIDTDRNRLARAALIKLGHSVGRRDLAQKRPSLDFTLWSCPRRIGRFPQAEPWIGMPNRELRVFGTSCHQ